MVNEEMLRQLTRLDKVMNKTTYKEIANKIGLGQSSMYNWLNGYFSLGAEKRRRLEDLYGCNVYKRKE